MRELLTQLLGKYLKFAVSTGRIINLWEHNGWGNSIYFFDWKDRELAGHMTPRPSVGDEVRAKLKQGIGRFRIISVDYKKDPPDMFFAKVKDIGYVVGVV